MVAGGRWQVAGGAVYKCTWAMEGVKDVRGFAKLTCYKNRLVRRELNPNFVFMFTYSF